MKLNAKWITGFVDGEGCFHIGISRHKEMTVGYQVLPEFTVVQHERDVQILDKLKSFFGCGVVRKNNGDRKSFRVRNLKHLNEIVIPFFNKHCLNTKKAIDFQLFKNVVEMMNQQQHLCEEGLEEIRKISSKMNRGRSR